MKRRSVKRKEEGEEVAETMPSTKAVSSSHDADEMRASLLAESDAKRSRRQRRKVVVMDETNVVEVNGEEASVAAPPEDEEELLLKAALFGQRIPTLKVAVAADDAEAEDEHANAPDEALFRMDAAGSDEDEHDGAARKSKNAAVWQDSDDEEVEVDLSKSARLRKLRKEEEEQLVRGDVYTERLREQHERIYGRADWAKMPENGGEEEDEEEALLKHRSTLVDKTRRKHATDRTGKVNLVRLKDANVAEYSKCVVRALDWHQTSPELMLTGGMDKTLRLFRVDGEKNAKLQSVHFADLPIYSAKFLGSNNVVLSGRRPYFYSYDLESGNLRKVNGIFGREPRDKSLEMLESSQDHDTIAFACRDGFISLVSRSGGFKEVGNVRLAGGIVRKMSFFGSQELMASGDDGELCKWDLRNLSRPLWRRRDEGSLSGRSLACNHVAKLYAAGSSNGVVNIYRDDEKGSKFKTIMNLTTSVDSSAFSPSGKLLCIASSRKRDAVRIVHMPTGGQVVVNWPLSKTPLAHVSHVAFSHSGGLLACGNDRGKVLLWKIQGET